MSNEQSIRDDIRSAYIRPAGIFGGYGAEHRAELFDAWERRIQAEALREAADQLNHQMRRGMLDPVKCLELDAVRIEQNSEGNET